MNRIGFLAIFTLLIFLVGCGQTFQAAFYPDRTSQMDATDCEIVNTALRNAGYTDMVCQHGMARISGPPKTSILYLEGTCLIQGGGWGVAKVKLEGDPSNPVITLLSVNRKQ